MKILFLSQRVPFPPNRGDKITTWRLIERMARTHEVTCMAFAHDDADEEAAAALREKGFDTVTVRHHERRKKLTSLPLLATRTPLTLGVYGSSQLQREIDSRLGDFDVAYAYSSSMGAFLAGKGLPWIMHFAELDSDKWRQYAERTGPPMSWVYKREWRTLEQYERRLAADASQNVFCTPLEEKIFHQVIPGQPSTVLRNGVDLTHYEPAPESAEAGHLVFVGVMDYLPNVDGCVHFVQEILPLIRKEFPEATFSIVGSRPVPEVEQLANTPGVTVTGFVDDPKDWLRRAAVSVAPLRIARGIQNKVLEAMAMGLPIVGTECATQGVGAEDGRDYIVAESAEAQAKAICDLLRHPSRARELGAAARQYVEQHYDWERVFDPLDSLLLNAKQGKQAAQ